MKYLVYGKVDGKVWRDLDQYVIEDDGTLFGGLNGENTLRYPPEVNVDVIEVDDAVFEAMDEDLSKYLIQNGEVVENPDWEPYRPKGYTEGYDQAVLDMIESGVL